MANNTRFVIQFIDSWPVQEIVELYKAAGWWKDTYNPSGILPLITGSLVFAVVIDSTSNKAVGMGRILSDGVSDAYIQDFFIMPKYRRLGLGKTLVQSLINYCLFRGINWIGLMAEPGSEDFYTATGFKPLENYTPMRFYPSGEDEDAFS